MRIPDKTMQETFNEAIECLPMGTLVVLMILPPAKGEVQYIANVNNEGVVKACKSLAEHYEVAGKKQL